MLSYQTIKEFPKIESETVDYGILEKEKKDMGEVFQRQSCLKRPWLP